MALESPIASNIEGLLGSEKEHTKKVVENVTE